MEFVCQFFEDKKHVVRLYIATGDNIYKAEAERFYNCPIMFLNDFVQESGNVFIWEDIQIMVLGEYLYIFDEDQNYISIEVGTWMTRNIYITNIERFNTTWRRIHCIFAELCVGDIGIRNDIASRYVKVDDMFLPITDKFAFYNNGKITKLCLE